MFSNMSFLIIFYLFPRFYFALGEFCCLILLFKIGSSILFHLISYFPSGSLVATHFLNQCFSDYVVITVYSINLAKLNITWYFLSSRTTELQQNSVYTPPNLHATAFLYSPNLERFSNLKCPEIVFTGFPWLPSEQVKLGRQAPFEALLAFPHQYWITWAIVLSVD